MYTCNNTLTSIIKTIDFVNSLMWETLSSKSTPPKWQKQFEKSHGPRNSTNPLFYV